MIKHFVLWAASAAACAAQMPIVSENFDGGGASEAFLREFHIDGSAARARDGKLVFDCGRIDKDWVHVVRFPKKGYAPLCKKIYAVSFDYKVLEKTKSGHWVAAFIRNDNGLVVVDGSAHFAFAKGESGSVSVFSNPMPQVEKGFFYISPRKTGAKVEIDNFKVEEMRVPEWAVDKFGKPIWAMRILPTNGIFLLKNPGLADMPRDKFYPFIDKFGQFKHKEWPGKVHSVEELRQRAEEEAARYADVAPIPCRDKYFGYLNGDFKFNATGRFRVEKIGGKWFFITPEGNLFWSLGVDTAGLYQGSPTTMREHYFDDVAGGKFTRRFKYAKRNYTQPYDVLFFELRNLEWKYGENWRDTYWRVADRRARAWGINTFGCWTQPFIFDKCGIPFAATLGAPAKPKIKALEKTGGLFRDMPDFFEPNFRKNTMRAFAKAKKTISKPNCIGVFVDNELPWRPSDLQLAREVLASPKTQPSKMKFAEILKNKYGEIEALNKAWAADYKDWEGFLQARNFSPKTKAARADMLKFEDLFYREYFSVCRDAIKAADPAALYLGCRFAWGTDVVRRIASEYCDVVSYNWYKDDASELALPKGSADKPIIIGEFHFGNQDRGVFGGGLRPCRTMDERIARTKKYVHSALRNPNIVGAHWFRWADQATTGRQDGENYCCGMVDICDTPIYEFGDAMRGLSQELYDVRLNSAK